MARTGKQMKEIQTANNAGGSAIATYICSRPSLRLMKYLITSQTEIIMPTNKAKQAIKNIMTNFNNVVLFFIILFTLILYITNMKK